MSSVEMLGVCQVCKMAASHVCSGCRIVNYCSKHHQKQHWKSHKADCRPLFQVEHNDKLGRYLVATRHIEKGRLVLQEAPLVVGPKYYSQPVCLGCLALCEPSSTHECDGCGYPLCSVQCQVSDHHFDECQLMMRNNFRASINVNGSSQRDTAYFPIVPLRCLMLAGKAKEKMLSLESHLSKRIATPLYNLYKNNVYRFIRERMAMADFDEETVLTVCGILDTNAFEVRSKTANHRALFHTASMLAHDCTPNTRHTFHGPDSVIAITATRDIQQGQIIAATYTQTFWGTLARREHLSQSKCFDCTCDRCEDPTELGTYLGAIRCTRCSNYIVSNNPLDNTSTWTCQGCGHVVPVKHIRSGNEQLKKEITQIDKTTVDGLENFLDKYGSHSNGVLHSNNTHLVQVKHALVHMYGAMDVMSDEHLEKRLEYIHDLLELVDVLDPGYSKIRGQLLNDLQATMVIQAKRHFDQDKTTKDAAQKTLSEAMAILKEVIEIMRIEPEIESISEELGKLAQLLD